jgi:hypothetical protein
VRERERERGATPNPTPSMRKRGGSICKKSSDAKEDNLLSVL